MIRNAPQPSGRTGTPGKSLPAKAALAMLATLIGTVPAQGQAPAAGTVLKDTTQTPEGFPFPLRVELGTYGVDAGESTQTASAGYLSYTRPGEDNRRPVIFAFNGGPGASSSFLHMGLLGPSLAEVEQDPAKSGKARSVPGSSALYENADVVFIDPPGTGFSARPQGEAAAPYNTVAGDARAASQLVRQWLEAHGRTDAPIFVLGESYGTIRAVAMLDALESEGLSGNLRGIVLLGQALNMIETSQRPDNVVTYAVSLPTLAAIACYHGKAATPCNAADVGSRNITGEAARFAREEYLPALYQGRDLPEAERDRLAAKLEDLTGIPAAYYREHDLRISKERFRVELLRDEGKVMGRYDARYIDARPAEVTTFMPGDPASVISDAYGEAMDGYLGETLAVPGAADYKKLTGFAGGWSYGGSDSPFSDWPFMTTVEKHASSNACLRVFVGTGLYDTTTTIGAADYLFAQSDLPAARYRNERYVGGHVFYSDNGSRERFQSDLVQFIKNDACS